MNLLRVGAVVRAVRVKRRLTQRAVAARAGVSQSGVSRLERGHGDGLTLATIESICAVLDIRVDVLPRWRGGDVDRLLNARHAGMHEAVAEWFGRLHPDWILVPEVSFSIYGERGVIDILAWHPASRSLLVIELKTDLVDLNEHVGTLDRKRRLAMRVAEERGWKPVRVGVWLVVAATRTNRRRLADHSAFLANALPDTGTTVRAWLRKPDRALAAKSIETFGRPLRDRTVRRVRPAPARASATPATAAMPAMPATPTTPANPATPATPAPQSASDPLMGLPNGPPRP